MNLPRKTILAFCCVGMVQVSLAIAAPAMLVTPAGAMFRMSTVQQGLFLSAAPWGLALATLIVGPLADRVGLRPLLVAGAVLEAAGLAIIWRADGQGAAISGAAVLGTGAGLTDPLLTPLVCALYPDRRTRVSNLLHSFYPVGLIVTTGLMILLMNRGWAWQDVSLATAALAIPAALAMLVLPLPAQTHEGAHRMGVRRIIGRGAFLLLVATIFMGGVTELGPSSWLPAMVQEAAGGTRTQGGLGLMAFGAIMAVGRFSSTAIVHRIGPRLLFVLGGAVCVAGLLLAALPLGAFNTILWLSVVGFGVAGFWPTVLGCAGDRFPQAGASMYSVLSAVGNFGGVVGPMAIGLAAKSFGLQAGVALLAVAPLAAVVCFSLAGRSKAKREE
ncbi:MAG: sugar MFS transporter [Phycisphaerae bacterium]